MKTFFADSYAIIDYLRGNKNFRKYFEENLVITTRFNLMEVYYSTLLCSTEDAAEMHYASFSGNCVEVSDETLKDAMKFKLKEKARKISYVDAIGYCAALERNVPFLTGDKQFKDMKNVEFVK